jgi:hypothetical protein
MAGASMGVDEMTSMREWVKRLVRGNAVLAALFYRGLTPGQLYIHRDHINKNPFNDDPLLVEILEVKGKWVRYRHAHIGSFFQDESMERSAFNFTFTLYAG